MEAADNWGDIQAYFEVRDWKQYKEKVQLLEQKVRTAGEKALADKIKNLIIAAREENEYYIEAHQADIINEYHGKFDVQEAEEQDDENYEAIILIVDDDKESLKRARTILDAHAEIHLAGSAMEAFGRMEEVVPDLLLIDIYMPDMDGFKMMKLLKKNDRLKEIPVIFLTADHDLKIEVKGFKAGAQDFITKPLRKEIVLQRVHRILELSRLQKNLQREVEKQTKNAEERRTRFENLSLQIVNALVEAIDAKDAYTKGHSGRVAEYSVKLAERAGKSKEEVERIRYVGLLHDIGKIGIPDSIITKSSSLSETEYIVTRKHPEIGAEILEKIIEIPGLSVGARFHHERYDGTGYPEGRSGTYIPEEARIIAVADAYDAMASKRSYRDVLPQQEIYEEIQLGRGTQFDPVYADIMLELMEEDVNYDMREK